MVSEGGVVPSEAKPVLKDLARLLFKCRCGTIMHWKRVAAHHHICRTYRAQLPSTDDRQGFIPEITVPLLEMALRVGFLEQVLSPAELELEICADRMESLFEAAGKDMASATYAQMDELDAWFQCMQCTKPERLTIVYSWQEAVRAPR